MKRLLVLGAAMALCIAIAALTNYSKQQPPSNAVETAASAAPPAPRRPTAVGINLAPTAYWGGERSFMNLALGGNWAAVPGWGDFDRARIGRDYTILSLKPNERAALALTRPAATYRGDVPIRCRYEGDGELDGVGLTNMVRQPGQFDFVWPTASSSVVLIINRTDPANPVRHIDCREAKADPKALFDPDFIDSLRPFKSVRFMDWQQINANARGGWADRTMPTSNQQSGPRGVALELMVDLANEAKVDPWFVMPWTADAAYVENFARYVHDHLAPDRTVYVEVGNEVWNMAFPVARQALAEGKRANLGTSDEEARMRRYAQRSVEALSIWERVFANNPERLVRVMSGQNTWPQLLEIAVGYKDTARHVDALSSAVYFGHDLFTDAPDDLRDLGPYFTKLRGSIAPALAAAKAHKQLADRLGLRFLSYEAGQHATYNLGKDPTVITRLNRDPRMGEIYRAYLADWDREFGDVLMLYHSVGPMGPVMQFGLAEYSGQPMAETPKRKAVLDAIKTFGK